MVKQYTELLKTEKMAIQFTDDGLGAIAKIAAAVNATQENIGARRLYTVMECLLEDESFNAPDLKDASVVVDEKMVEKRLEPILRSEDLSNFIL